MEWSLQRRFSLTESESEHENDVVHNVIVLVFSTRRRKQYIEITQYTTFQLAFG